MTRSWPAWDLLKMRMQPRLTQPQMRTQSYRQLAHSLRQCLRWGSSSGLLGCAAAAIHLVGAFVVEMCACMQAPAAEAAGKGKKKKGKKAAAGNDDEDIEALLAELDGPPRPATPPAEVGSQPCPHDQYKHPRHLAAGAAGGMCGMLSSCLGRRDWPSCTYDGRQHRMTFSGAGSRGFRRHVWHAEQLSQPSCTCEYSTRVDGHGRANDARPSGWTWLPAICTLAS